ncbi:hypothetical protein M0R45_027435 [Rubus argutus]|uniref:MHC class I antigen n=1 Tax=Rubus argutus TaxID=59490 RepID=A0AAW1X262_RUBAR
MRCLTERRGLWRAQHSWQLAAAVDGATGQLRSEEQLAAVMLEIGCTAWGRLGSTTDCGFSDDAGGLGTRTMAEAGFLGRARAQAEREHGDGHGVSTMAEDRGLGMGSALGDGEDGRRWALVIWD